MRFLIVDAWSVHGLTTKVGRYEIRYFNPKIFLSLELYKTYPTAERIVALHRTGDKSMIAMLKEFLRSLRDFGAIGIAVHQNPFPPEWLVENAQDLIRILGCFDDPQKTYTATLPVVWAYHGAYYCSPSYSRTQRFADTLRMFGVTNSHWFPLSQTMPTNALVEAVESSWSRRMGQAIYIGKCYGDKVDKLAKFNRGIGGKLRLHGQNWPLAGLAGFVAPLRGRTLLPKRVLPVDDTQRRDAYLASLVGLNMHLGDGEETGNMRMYEAPMHGTMLLCDKAGCDAHGDIFAPDLEAVYYGSIDEAVEKCLYYFDHPDQAIAIARRGFKRAQREYAPNKVLGDLLDWAASLRGLGPNPTAQDAS